MGARIHWMDNLRTVTIFCVVLYHIGGVYEAAGLWAWFWIVDDPTTMVWVGVMGIVLDVFAMPTLFFISGYLAPASLDNRSPGRFVLGKFRRLIIPWAIAVLTLIPLYKIIFLYSRGLPQEHWTTYFHVTNPNSQNWLWFLPVLFCFYLVYLLITRFNLKSPKISPVAAVLGAAAVAFVHSFFIGGVLGFRSWTLTPLVDFENERLGVYFLCFLLGVLFCRQGIFAEKPKGKLLYNIANGTAWVPVLAHIFVRLIPFFSEGFEVTAGYRVMWWVSFDLALLCLLYVLVETFRRYFDRTGSLWGELNRNSYGVYVIHVILIGVFGTLLMKTGLPVWLKYPTLIVLVYAGSNLLVSGYRRVKAVRSNQ
jgi:surface polysaccharide O-acyltransferase-like enzyme